MPKIKSEMVFPLLSVAWVFLFTVAAGGQSVMINEFMASNDQTLADHAGDYDDWIEFYNPSDQAVDLAGMFLTDDLNDLSQWQFPATDPNLTTIEPYGYLLVWADKDSDIADLHADFKLSADGESVGLVSSRGELIDSVTYGDQLSDVSWGLDPNGTWVYMATPTPGAANVEGLLGLVEPVSFSVTRGFYDEPITVSLSTTTEDAEIWVSLDGTLPHTKHVSGRGTISYDGEVYSGPMTVETTTCIRALAIKTGWQDSEVVSHSYIYLDDVIEQDKWPDGAPTKWDGKSTMNGHSINYEMDPHVVQDEAYVDEIEEDLLAIPSMCIVMPHDDLFGEEGFYANGSRDGDEWERTGTLEWIDPETGANFGVNAGFRSHGGVGRAEVKHSIRTIFRGEYGLGKLEFPLFKDSTVDTFDQLIFRATWNYSWIGDSTACSGLGTDQALYLRETFARDTCMEMGLLTPPARHIHLYINGLYWGVYILSERPDESFAAEHLGGSEDDYDVLKASNTTSRAEMELKAGDQAAWDLLFDLAGGDLSSLEDYVALQDLVDVNDMIDYMLMIYYVGSRDAPVYLCNDVYPRNFYAIRDRDALGGFLFIPWDCEWSLEEEGENRVEIVGELNPHYLMNQLSANDEFRMLLADHIYRQFFHDGPLTEEASVTRLMQRADEIYGAIVGESARWGDLLSSDPYTRDNDWADARDRLLDDYFPKRTEYVLSQLQDEGWYPSINPPTFAIDGTEVTGGQVERGSSLTILPAEDAEFEGYDNGHGGWPWTWPWNVSSVGERSSGDPVTYYTLDGSDPRALGGGVAETALTYSTALILNATTHIKTRALSDEGEWSALHDVIFAIDPVVENLRITELMYHADDPNTDFIELSNVGDETINLAYVQLSEGVEFTFPDLDLAVHGSMVVVADADVFTSLYGDAVPVAGVYQGRLSNDPERLVLSDALGTVIHDFVYDDQWQPTTDGDGASLVICDPNADPNGWGEPGFWTAGSLLGTPGSLQDAVEVLGLGPVVISEIMFHPRLNEDAEYIELTNISDEAVTLYDAQTLSAWEVTGGVDIAFGGRESIVLEAGACLLLVKDAETFQSVYGTPSGVSLYAWGDASLANCGDELNVVSPSQAWSDQVRFSDGLHGEDFASGQDPWPVTADGMGKSLGRVSLTHWGNWVGNWQATEPTPGQR